MNRRQKEAVAVLAALHPDVWFDNAAVFSCAEAEAIAEFMTAFDTEGDLFLGYHAMSDDEGDSHTPIMRGDFPIGARRQETANVRSNDQAESLSTCTVVETEHDGRGGSARRVSPSQEWELSPAVGDQHFGIGM